MQYSDRNKLINAAEKKKIEKKKERKQNQNPSQKLHFGNFIAFKSNFSWKIRKRI